MPIKRRSIRIFSTPGFCIAWWKAFGGNRSLRLVLIEDSKEPRLIAPLYCDNTEPGQLVPIGYHYADFTDMVMSHDDSAALDQFFAWLFGESGCSKLTMRGLPTDGPLFQRYRNAPDITATLKARILTSLNITQPPVYASVTPGHLFANRGELQACKDILAGEHYRRRINWFNKRGKLLHQTLRDVDSCREILPAFFAMHSAQFDSQNLMNNSDAESIMSFSRDDSRRFFYGLTEQLCPQSRMQIDVLSLDETPIAMHVAFRLNGSMHCYKCCFDSSCDRSPGKVLFGHILKDAAEDDIRQMEGLGSYASGVASERKDTGSIIVYRSNQDAVLSELKRACERLGIGRRAPSLRVRG